ncbi:MAG: D-glucuronyl C5-epimerase family protein [Actinomycetota bacterium]
MITRQSIPLLCALACAVVVALPAAADASPLIVVDGAKQTVINDTFLAPPTADDLAAQPPPPAPAQASDGKVMATLRAALERRSINQDEYDHWREIYINALNTATVLSGRCRGQLATVISQLQRMARAGDLTPSRMPILFLQLQRNTEYWASSPNISNGGRVSFAGEFVIWQHYAGQGLQFQPLANWGRAAAVAEYCRKLGPYCISVKQSLASRIDTLISLASVRHGATAWEYYFSFDGGAPPWMSGMAQGTALQALSVGAQVLNQAFYLQVARTALPSFSQPTPYGVAVAADGGRHYALYSFAPKTKVLNGFLQAILGLKTFAAATKDPLAIKLARLGDRAARRETPRYDTGKWSLYQRPGRKESTTSYHILVRDFLRRMCRLTGAKVYCHTAARFTYYLHKRGIADNAPEAAGTTPVAPGAPTGPRCGA